MPGIVRITLWVGLALALGACQGPGPVPQATDTLPPLAVAPSEARVYRVDPDASRIRFIVRRGGTLARLGHNHVILARQVEGDIRLASDPSRSTVTLALPVSGFQVDPADERAALGEGFGPVPDAAVKGTTHNMLGEKVLDAARYPGVRVETVGIHLAGERFEVTVRITLHGVSRDQTIPVTLEQSQGRLEARAGFSVTQSDFGITPLAVLGGALQVEDAVEVRMDLIARAAGG